MNDDALRRPMCTRVERMKEHRNVITVSFNRVLTDEELRTLRELFVTDGDFIWPDASSDDDE